MEELFGFRTKLNGIVIDVNGDGEGGSVFTLKFLARWSHFIGGIFGADGVSLETFRDEPFILQEAESVLSKIGFTVDGHGIGAITGGDGNRTIRLGARSGKVRSGSVNETFFWFLGVAGKKHVPEGDGSRDNRVGDVGD